MNGAWLLTVRTPEPLFVQGKSTVTTDTYCSDCALELMGYRLTSDFMEVIQSHCLDIESSEGKSCAKCRILIG